VQGRRRLPETVPGITVNRLCVGLLARTVIELRWQEIEFVLAQGNLRNLSPMIRLLTRSGLSSMLGEAE
jgi:hypothetical protein